MSDPVGLIGGASGPLHEGRPGPVRPQPTDGDAFRKALFGQLREVSAMRQDADKAVEDLLTGQRTDLEGVLLATQKADTAFQLLQQMRNKVMEAYQEIQQMRV
ncbi:MAG: flagellar hook-basal body complex protein FliE [Phycisphaeraceae bacterium]|nr:flagellar hook-basal body complex protein FliE [Phycisphaeraceae bacterium]